MDTSAHVGESERSPARSSLGVRFPIALAAFIAVVLGSFLAVAYRQLDAMLVQNGGVRAQTAAAQLANLMGQNTQQRLRDVERIAKDAATRHALQEPGDDSNDLAERTLTSLTAPGQPDVELWNAKGERVLRVPSPPAPNGAPAVFPPSHAPTKPGTSVLYAAGDVVFYEVVAEVPGDGASSSTASASTPLGYVLTRRTLTSAAASDVIGRLVGGDAVVTLGNRAGGVWTNLSKVVAAPPVDMARNGVAEYRAKDGQELIGATAPIRDTPWTVWVQFPRSGLVAPAWTFLTRMILIGVVFVVVAALLGRQLSAHVTTPLRDLTTAAEAIARGQYAARVSSSRRDEIGRLGAAFNIMSAQIHDAQRTLEARVQERTAVLADTARQLENSVREHQATREEVDRFFTLSLDLLCIAGKDGYLKRLNPAWQEVLGWTPDELTSRPYREFVHPDDIAMTEAEASRLAHGLATQTFENRYRAKDGSYRWLQWKAVSLPDRALTYAAARDITNQKQAEADTARHVADLAALNQELEAFSYSVSHDLRAPLRHIMGFAALLSQQAGATLDDRAKHHLNTITSAADRMGHLIDDLLAFSRMGRSALSKRRVQLETLVRDVQREVVIGSPSRDILWTVHPLPEIDADPAMLRLALVNLLSNAVKYTGKQPSAHIEIGLQGRANGEAVIFVRDNGVGFDMEYAHKLFGVFQRLHRSDEFAGTGIGLANVRRIIHRHGGKVWAEGAVGEGATFYFSLPTQSGVH